MQDERTPKGQRTASLPERVSSWHPAEFLKFLQTNPSPGPWRLTGDATHPFPKRTSRIPVTTECLSSHWTPCPIQKVVVVFCTQIAQGTCRVSIKMLTNSWVHDGDMFLSRNSGREPLLVNARHSPSVLAFFTQRSVFVSPLAYACLVRSKSHYSHWGLLPGKW